MRSNPAHGDTPNPAEDEPKSQRLVKITPEQAAAIKQFGDSIIESLDVSERLRREQVAEDRRRHFHIV